MNDNFQRFSLAIAEIYRYWNKIATEVMEKYGLKGSCSVYFAAMYRNNDGVTATKLGQICNRNKADVSRVISQMIEKGFARKENPEKNCYRAKLFLTEKGKQVARHIEKCAQKVTELGGSGLSQQQKNLFYDSLELVSRNLKLVSKEGLTEQ